MKWARNRGSPELGDKAKLPAATHSAIGLAEGSRESSPLRHPADVEKAFYVIYIPKGRR